MENKFLSNVVSLVSVDSERNVLAGHSRKEAAPEYTSSAHYTNRRQAPSICLLLITLPQAVKGTAKGNGFINTTWLLTSLQVGWGLEPPQLGTHTAVIHISEKSTRKILNGMQKVIVIRSKIKYHQHLTLSLFMKCVPFFLFHQ